MTGGFALLYFDGIQFRQADAIQARDALKKRAALRPPLWSS